MFPHNGAVVKTSFFTLEITSRNYSHTPVKVLRRLDGCCVTVSLVSWGDAQRLLVSPACLRLLGIISLAGPGRTRQDTPGSACVYNGNNCSVGSGYFPHGYLPHHWPGPRALVRILLRGAGMLAGGCVPLCHWQAIVATSLLHDSRQVIIFPSFSLHLHKREAI